MSKIEANAWRPFRVGDYFEELKTGYVGPGRKIGTATTEPDEEHTIPLTCAKCGNNGVMYYGRPGDYTTYKNVISVIRDGAVSTGMVYAQKDETGTYSHSYFIRAKESRVTFEANLFVSRVLENTIYPRYTRDDACIWKRVAEEIIMLPATSSGDPDWDYMDAYMREMLQSASDSLESLSQVRGGGTRLKTKRWKPFTIGGKDGLFKIAKGSRLTRADMIEGDLPFIGASTANNGVTAYVGNTEHVHPGNVITVAYNGQKATGKAFYQPRPFWASDDVHVLYPNFELNKLRALFLLPIFRIVGEPYAFEDKWKIEFMEKDCLLLPVNDAGEPDWVYMEACMEDVMSAVRVAVDELDALRLRGE